MLGDVETKNSRLSKYLRCMTFGYRCNFLGGPKGPASVEDEYTYMHLHLPNKRKDRQTDRQADRQTNKHK